MPSFNVRTVINYIKRLTPGQRQAELRDLLSAFPDDWLAEAVWIAQSVREARGNKVHTPAPPRRVDPLLRRIVR